MMNKSEAKHLAQYHKFTKQELYDILEEALDTFPDEYWIKPNKVNPIFDNGYYFNRCREWINYNRGDCKDNKCPEIVVVRILEVFGKFSKVQLPKKKKVVVPIQVSEKPVLEN